MSEERPLSALATCVTRKANSTAKDVSVPYVGLEHLVTDDPRVRGTAPASSSIGVNTIFEPNDTLFGKLRPNLRKVVLADFRGYCSTDILVLRAQPGTDSRYLSHLMRSHSVLGFAAATAFGTKMPRTSWSLLGTQRVFLPSLWMQQKIAEILDTLDDQIHLTSRLISKLELVESGLVNDVLNCGVDVSGRLRQSGTFEVRAAAGRSFPASWSLVRLDQIADVDRGKFGHRPRNDPAYLYGTYPFIQTGDVGAAKGGLITTASQSLSNLGALVSREFPAGTIAVTIAANIADTAILGRPMYFPDSVVGVGVRAPHKLEYVELIIRSAKPRLEARAPQSAQRNINLQDLRPLEVPLPDPAEQARICDVLSAHAAAVDVERKKLAKLTKLKAGLLSDLLSCRTRVPLKLAS